MLGKVTLRFHMISPLISRHLLFIVASGNLFAIIFLFSEDALRAPLSANPPENMKQAIIFQGAFVLVVCLTILGLRGQQVRRSRDEEESKARGGAEGAILGMQNARQ
jgi:hypothetical protein